MSQVCDTNVWHKYMSKIWHRFMSQIYDTNICETNMSQIYDTDICHKCMTNICDTNIRPLGILIWQFCIFVCELNLHNACFWDFNLFLTCFQYSMYMSC